MSERSELIPCNNYIVKFNTLRTSKLKRTSSLQRAAKLILFQTYPLFIVGAVIGT